MDQNLIMQYTRFLKELGYSNRTVHYYSTALEQAPSSWNTDIAEDLYEHITNTLKTKTKCFKSAAIHNIKPASSLLFLMRTGITFKSFSKHYANKNSSYSDILEEFYHYSNEFKHMTKLSAEAETHHVIGFLDTLNGLPNDWSNITAEHVRDYVCHRLNGLKASSIGRYITSLRNFFRFLEYKGVAVNHSVLDLPLAPADWNKNKVPETLSLAEEIRLRNYYNQNSQLTVQSKIIIRLMLDLGLRCTEVANLKLNDICWNNGVIDVKKPKNKHNRKLPLSRELGLLLEEYVIDQRPCIKSEYLFLREGLNKQYTAMSRENVRYVIRRAFEQENIHGWWKGTHSLRRTAASRIYNSGSGLKITADLLGHESLESTKQYVRVDFASLREIVNPWPGGDSDD